MKHGISSYYEPIEITKLSHATQNIDSFILFMSKIWEASNIEVI